MLKWTSQELEGPWRLKILVKNVHIEWAQTSPLAPNLQAPRFPRIWSKLFSLSSMIGMFSFFIFQNRTLATNCLSKDHAIIPCTSRQCKMHCRTTIFPFHPQGFNLNVVRGHYKHRGYLPCLQWTCQFMWINIKELLLNQLQNVDGAVHFHLKLVKSRIFFITWSHLLGQWLH